MHDAEKIASAREELRSGTQTYERPEVGWLNGCTGTLVAPNVIVTAAHCENFESKLTVGNHGSFTVMATPTTDAWTSTVDLVKVYNPSGAVTPDVALLRLATSVPDSVAHPARLAAAIPAQGTPVTLYGYGCTQLGSSVGMGTKRKLSYAFAPLATNNVCPGDSGGPTLVDATGEVFYVNSMYTSFGDRPAETVSVHAQLVAQIQQWSGDTPPPPPPPPPAGDTTPPTVNVVSPSNGASFAAYSWITIAADATDDVAVTKIGLSWPYSSAVFACDASRPSVTCTRSGSRFTWQVYVGAGSRSFSVVAEDAAGNETTSPAQTISLQ